MGSFKGIRPAATALLLGLFSAGVASAQSCRSAGSCRITAIRGAGGVRALLLACLLSVPGVQARAENWPEHGYYFVRDGTQGNHRYCELMGSLKVDRAIFALVIREFSSGSLMVQFLTQDAIIDKAEQVVIGIDRKEILRFNRKRFGGDRAGFELTIDAAVGPAAKQLGW